ncbi:hypothetical protein GGI21_001334 [Coemansia aciculifera]|nr:hypothetical protein GGI21_001334 [Coemansia aciculifera]
MSVTFRAVSNFMWIDVDDCTHMHGLLHESFKWTDAERERAAQLRAQGLTWKEVARRLSPTLKASSVLYALKQHTGAMPAPAPISADVLNEVDRLVDKYAGKHSVPDIMAKIRRQLSLVGCVNSYNNFSRRIAEHPHYQAKLRDIDFTDLANRVAAGQTSVTLAAKELNVPRYILARRMLGMISKQHSSRWTEEETRKLIDYVRGGCSSEPDLIYFSKLLGTKSSVQCGSKIMHLKRKGFFPRCRK